MTGTSDGVMFEEEEERIGVDCKLEVNYRLRL